MAKGEDIILNNSIISGNIIFQIGRRQPSGTNIITNTDKGETIEISIESMKELFLSFNSINIDFQETYDAFIVKFTKYADS
jgi:hypothetical protein